jgi:Flp pilus assembly protein TadD
MVEIVKQDNEGHRALNLLGYCYKEIGQEEEAFTIFKTSLQKKNNCQNAAVYHLCLMVLKHM